MPILLRKMVLSGKKEEDKMKNLTQQEKDKKNKTIQLLQQQIKEKVKYYHFKIKEELIITIAFYCCSDYDRAYYYGISICNLKQDQFSRLEGRLLSTKRLLENKKHYKTMSSDKNTLYEVAKDLVFRDLIYYHKVSSIKNLEKYIHRIYINCN